MQYIYSSYLFENIFFKAMQYATVFPVLGNSITLCLFTEVCLYENMQFLWYNSDVTFHPIVIKQRNKNKDNNQLLLLPRLITQLTCRL